MLTPSLPTATEKFWVKYLPENSFKLLLEKDLGMFFFSLFEQILLKQGNSSFYNLNNLVLGIPFSSLTHVFNIMPLCF